MPDRFQFTAALSGPEIDLDMLQHCFKSGAVEVKTIFCELIGSAPLVHLVSPELILDAKIRIHQSSSGGEVHLDETFADAREIAMRLLQLGHGACRLVRAEFRPVSISSLHKFSLAGDLQASHSWEPFGDSWRSYPLPPERKGLTDLVRSWVGCGITDEAVSLALEIYGNQTLGWTSLYMIYEVIRDDVGSPALERWVDKRKLRDFAGTANNCRLMREGIRHAFRNEAWDKDRAISLTEGESIIRHLMNQWLGDKVGMTMR